MSPARMDRVEVGVRTMIAFTEALNKRDLASMMALVSDECTFESSNPPPDGSLYHGKASISEYFQRMFAQSSQLHLKIEEAFGFGYRCIMLWRLDWTDAKGSTGHMRGVDICRVQDGLICEQFSYVKG
jgi:ketosteroid isomerase-like protein